MAEAVQVEIDARQLLTLNKHLKSLENGTMLSRSLRQGLREAAKPVLAEAKSRAAQASSHIASTLSTSVSFTGKRSGVFITAKGSKMPSGHEKLPALMENGGKQGTFRHPLFGNRNHWVNQPAHPFLHPALESKRGEIEQIIRKSIADFLDRENI